MMNAHNKNKHLEDELLLAEMIMQLFALWDLDTASQLNLLGLSETSRALLSKLKRGEAVLPHQRDSLDRISLLLAIHQSLRLLYPQNPKLRYDWVNRKNKKLNNETPLEIILRDGILGLSNISRYLNFFCSR